MVREIFKPSVASIGFSVGFFLVLFFIYPATVPAVGLACSVAGGKSAWIFYNYYCVSGFSFYLLKFLGTAIWTGVLVVVYSAMSFVFNLEKKWEC